MWYVYRAQAGMRREILNVVSDLRRAPRLSRGLGFRMLSTEKTKKCFKKNGGILNTY